MSLEDREYHQRLVNGTLPVIITNPLTTVKFPAFDKIKWRYRIDETPESSRWSRNHTRIAEYYYFWEIQCKGKSNVHIPLEELERYNLESLMRKIPVPRLIIDYDQILRKF